MLPIFTTLWLLLLLSVHGGVIQQRQQARTCPNDCAVALYQCGLDVCFYTSLLIYLFTY